MTVAHLTTVHPAEDNRIAFKECVALRDAGIDVVLLAKGDVERDFPVRHVPLAIEGGRIRRILSGYGAAWSALRDERPRLLHFHDPELILFGIAYRRLFKIPVIYDAHENLGAQVLSKEYIWKWARPHVARVASGLERLADRCLDAIVIAEPALRSNYSRDGRVVLVQNFPWKRDFPDPVPLPPELSTLGYIGAISVQRGVREMCAALDRSQFAQRLVMAGTISGDEAERSVKGAQKVDYRGRVGVEDIPALLASAHVGLCILHPLPNYVEAQSTKIFEYLAAGRPFVYSNFPSWVDMFESEGVGLSVDPFDVEALTVAIDSLLRDPERAQKMGTAGRALLERRFTFEAEAPGLVGLTRELSA